MFPNAGVSQTKFYENWYNHLSKLAEHQSEQVCKTLKSKVTNDEIPLIKDALKQGFHDIYGVFLGPLTNKAVPQIMSHILTSDTPITLRALDLPIESIEDIRDRTFLEAVIGTVNEAVLSSTEEGAPKNIFGKVKLLRRVFDALSRLFYSLNEVAENHTRDESSTEGYDESEESAQGEHMKDELENSATSSAQGQHHQQPSNKQQSAVDKAVEEFAEQYTKDLNNFTKVKRQQQNLIKEQITKISEQIKNLEELKGSSKGHGDGKIYEEEIQELKEDLSNLNKLLKRLKNSSLAARADKRPLEEIIKEIWSFIDGALLPSIVASTLKFVPAKRGPLDWVLSLLWHFPFMRPEVINDTSKVRKMTYTSGGACPVLCVVDSTGSMENGSKILLAMETLLRTFDNYVMPEKVSLYLSSFHNGKFSLLPTRIKTREQLLRKFSSVHFSGGHTGIGELIVSKKFVETIQNLKATLPPGLKVPVVIITDDEDNVDVGHFKHQLTVSYGKEELPFVVHVMVTSDGVDYEGNAGFFSQTTGGKYIVL